MAAVLMIVTSAARMSNGEPTGLWLEEFAVPYNLLRNAGHEVTVASPRGGAVPIDPRSVKEEPPADWADAVARLEDAVPLSGVRSADFVAVFVPGGHGTMFDFPGDPHVAGLLAGFHHAGKPIAAVCHGPAAFVDVVREDGLPLVDGFTLTAFSDMEEKLAGLADAVPFLLSERLRALGAKVENGLPLLSHVREDRNLLTGQNPKSSARLAELLIERLAAD